MPPFHTATATSCSPNKINGRVPSSAEKLRAHRGPNNASPNPNYDPNYKAPVIGAAKFSPSPVKPTIFHGTMAELNRDANHFGRLSYSHDERDDMPIPPAHDIDRGGFSWA